MAISSKASAGKPPARSRSKTARSVGKASPAPKTQSALGEIIKRINAKYGVVVAAAASNDEHAQGSMSPQRAAEIARRAGIITPSGNLSSLYK
jgi:hypothetical protein